MFDRVFVRVSDAEASRHGWVKEGEGNIDHLWIGVRDLARAHESWETVAAPLGLRVTSELPERFHLAAGGRSFAIVADGRPDGTIVDIDAEGPVAGPLGSPSLRS